jgi:hypothetical protein
MSAIVDGPASSLFRPLALEGLTAFDALAAQLPEGMAKALEHAPRGDCVAWGIPFAVNGMLPLKEGDSAVLALEPFRAGWLVFMHTADSRPLEWNQHGLLSPARGHGRLNELAAVYTVRFADGSEERLEIRRRHHINTYGLGWGENGFQCVAARKPSPGSPTQNQLMEGWGWQQTRVNTNDRFEWTNWLWAWQNPHPEKEVTGLRLESSAGTVVLAALSAGDVSENPLRWHRRRKAVLRLPDGVAFQPAIDEKGLLAQIQLDLGQVISAQPRPLYPNETWEQSYNNQIPAFNANEILIEYSAHPDADFHLSGGQSLAVADLQSDAAAHTLVALEPVASAHKRVTLRVVQRGTKRLLAVKLHIHGEAGEYLSPVDRHRIINANWFEDYSVDFTHLGMHPCSYIYGETQLDLPLGKVYLEVSKGFEIRPLRKVLWITPETEEVLVEVERVLPWRERGWVTADTHVHFLSPGSAMLEGAGEGVNVVNLLASQWGELMTNVGDFDGRSTWGSKESGGGPEGDGEYLVRVGTENRQHVLGHISLLGYSGRIIAPMTTGGPDESALGDPIEILLTEWARQCRQQGGIVVLPHFPNPRAEHAASIVSGDIDAVEMTAWGDHYSGIDPYSLSDWYRYLNCGYLVPAVGGTDKMWSGVAVGTVRTYARIPQGEPFTYDAWMRAVRRAETFVSYGPLLEFHVEGKPAGTRLALPASGGTLEVTYDVASVTIPVTQVDLVVNGEIRESRKLDAQSAQSANGFWRVNMPRSGWLALLVRGHYPDQKEMIAAHSSPVMALVEGSPLLPAADAVTILEQIEGAVAYLDTVGTRAADAVYKRMRLVLTAAHRDLHNRLHQEGHYHAHNALSEHP